MRDVPSDASGRKANAGAKPFRNQVGLFTAAAGRIGRCAAHDFADLGGNTVVADPDEGELARLGEELREQGHQPQLLVGNVADPEFLSQLYDRAHEEFGRVDHLLVNPTREDSVATLHKRGFHQQAWFEVNSVIDTRNRWLANLDARAGVQRDRSVTYLHSILPLGDDLREYQRQRLELGEMIRELSQQWASLRLRVNAVVPSTAQYVTHGPRAYSQLLDAQGAAHAILSMMWDPLGQSSGTLVETVAIGT
jgi:NAD(P)-dependent dehydrogenase (short-subunit alcohol dehydrogenase family)